MDVITYGAIKNVDKKLGLSMGEVGSNFGMTYDNFLVNFDGFDEVNSIKNVKTFNTFITDNLGAPLHFAFLNNQDGCWYGIDLTAGQFVKIDARSYEKTVIKVLDYEFLLQVSKITINEMNAHEYSPDLTKIIVPYVYSLEKAVKVLTIDMVNETVDTTTFANTYDADPGIGYNISALSSGYWFFDWQTNTLFVPFKEAKVPAKQFGILKLSLDNQTVDYSCNYDVEMDITTPSNFFNHFDRVNKKAYFIIKRDGPYIKQHYLVIFDIISNAASHGIISLKNGNYTTDSQNGGVYWQFLNQQIGNDIFLVVSCDKIQSEIAPSLVNAAYLMKIDASKANPCEFEFVCNDSWSSYTSYGSYQPDSTYRMLCTHKPVMIKKGDYLLWGFFASGSDNRSYTALRMVNIATKKAITTVSMSNLTNYNSIRFLGVLEWNETINSLYVVTNSNYIYSNGSTSPVSTVVTAYYNSPNYHIETQGETLMLISVIGNKNASMTFELQGKKYDRTILISDSGQKTMLLHSKTGIKFRVNTASTVDEVLWGVKANV